MPKYSMSSREKLLLAILCVLLVGGLWYRFVFVSVSDQLISLQTQEAEATDSITMNTAKLKRQKQMEDALAEFEAQGIQKREVPAYDNIAAVMKQLNDALRGSSSYDLSFDDLAWTSDGLIARGVSVTYTSGSYQAGKAILMSLYDGEFPCQVDTLSITDSSGNAIYSSDSSNSSVLVTAHLTYYEQVTDSSPTKGLPAQSSE